MAVAVNLFGLLDHGKELIYSAFQAIGQSRDMILGFFKHMLQLVLNRLHGFGMGQASINRPDHLVEQHVKALGLLIDENLADKALALQVTGGE
jgi:hypothetical protein